MANELIIPEKINPVVLFSDKKNIDDLIAGITQRAALETIDLETDKGRKEIASMAYAVSRSKTFLEDARKNVISDWKAKVDAVNANGKILRDSLDDLRDATRKPLTDWENAEKERIALIDKRFETINGYLSAQNEKGEPFTAQELKERLTELEAIEIDDLWGDETEKAIETINDTKLRVRFYITNQEKREAEALELEKLRIEKAARDKQDYEDRLKKEAADKARKEVEARIKAEADAAARRIADAEAAKAKAEADRIAAEAKAKADAAEALKKAEQDKLDAIAETERKAKAEADRKERERLEQERRAKAEADMALRSKELAAKNIEHQRAINAAALEDFISSGIDEAIAKKIIGLIAGGKIRNVSVNY